MLTTLFCPTIGLSTVEKNENIFPFPVEGDGARDFFVVAFYVKHKKPS